MRLFTESGRTLSHHSKVFFTISGDRRSSADPRTVGLPQLPQLLPPLGEDHLPEEPVLVEAGEAVDDDRDGEGEDEDAADGAHPAEDLAQPGLGATGGAPGTEGGKGNVLQAFEAIEFWWIAKEFLGG